MITYLCARLVSFWYIATCLHHAEFIVEIRVRLVGLADRECGLQYLTQFSGENMKYPGLVHELLKMAE